MTGHKSMKRNHKRKSRKNRKSRKSRKGGSVMGALKTALLPFLLYKAQKRQQKRVAKKKGGRRKRRKTMKKRRSRRRRRICRCRLAPLAMGVPVHVLDRHHK